MDGTTAGRLDGNLLAPSPIMPPAPVAGSLSQLSHPPVAQLPTPTVPVPVITQPQYSQVTPVYAPSPTNTVADIPQPAVKGIEFVQGPVSVAPPTVTPLAPAVAVEPPTPVAPNTMPALVPSTQLIQPVLPPSQPPQPQVVNQSVTLPTASPLTIADMSGPADYTKIENQIEDVDLDQMVNAVPPSASPPLTSSAPPVSSPPIRQNSPSATSTYFQGANSPISDVPTTENKFDPILIRRIAIIIGGVVILIIAGYFVISAIIGGKDESAVPTIDASPTPTITQPESTSADTSTPSATSDTSTTEDSSATTNVPDTPSSTNESPAVVVPVVTDSSAVEPTDTSVPSVANSGVQ